MRRGRRIAVVIPARNVEGAVRQVVEGIPAFVDTIVAVDDASRDGTHLLLAELAAAMRGRLAVLTLPSRRGVGGAIFRGYSAAQDRGADIVCVMAGDGQMDPADLECVIEPVLLGRADYAVGDRLSEPASRAAIPWARRIGIPVFAALTRWASGYAQIRDGQSGYTAISRQTLEMLLAEGFWAGYGVPNDILCRLGAMGARVETVPVRAVYPPGARSGIRPWHVLLSIPLVILRGAIRRGLSPIRPGSAREGAPGRMRRRLRKSGSRG